MILMWVSDENLQRRHMYLYTVCIVLRPNGWIHNTVRGVVYKAANIWTSQSQTPHPLQSHTCCKWKYSVHGVCSGSLCASVPNTKQENACLKHNGSREKHHATYSGEFTGLVFAHTLWTFQKFHRYMYYAHSLATS